MHTVSEMKGFRRAADEAGMTDEEIDKLVDFLSKNPEAGEEMEGTGGCRKVRVAGRGRGKSGGYRTVTFYSGDDAPVVLITVFSKGERSDLSQDERNALAKLTKELKREYSNKVVKVATKNEKSAKPR